MSNKITFQDNPPEPAPPYPGKKSRNCPHGILVTKHEYLQQQSDEWLQIMKNHNLYKTTYLSDKAWCLKHHLRLSSNKSEEVTQLLCRQLIESSEEILLPEYEQEHEHDEETEQNPEQSLRVEHNPPEKAPSYPGKLTQENPNGSMLSRQAYLQEESDQWFLYVKEKLTYRNTSMAHKARCLRHHLSNSHSKKYKVSQIQCRKFVKSAEYRLTDQEGVEPMESEQDKNLEHDHTKEENYTLNVEEKSRADDMNGSLCQADKEKIEGRTKKEWKLEKILSRSDAELFESRDTEMDDDDIKLMETSIRLKERLRAYLASKESHKIIFEEAQAPKFVINSKEYKKRLNISKKEKSGIMAGKEAKETIKLLAETPGKESREQRKIIGACVTSLRYGVPDIGLNWREEKVVQDMKRRLVTGVDKVLTIPNKEVREVLPASLSEVAKRYWYETTTPEPAKHRYLEKVLMDNGEAVPIRYQTTSDMEAYEGFVVMYNDEIRNIMKKHSQTLLDKYSMRRDSDDKKHQLNYAT